MTEAGTREGNDRPDWFQTWFGEAYLELYPHRDEQEAEAGVQLFLESSGLGAGAAVLDVACGAGRHLRSLRRHGIEAAGLDLSEHLLAKARASGPADPLVRADMRHLPFGEASFEGVTSFFTSFGYFERPEEDAGVAREIRRVLAAGGRFLLDFLNAELVRRSLVPEDVRIISGRRVRQIRAIEAGVVVKRIFIESDDGEQTTREFEERVRLYDVETLERELTQARLIPEDRYGSYDGEPFSPESPRLIIAGRAA